MKFTSIRQYFFEAVSSVERVVEKNTTLPILQNLLITAEKGRVVVAATNLEIGIRSSFQAKIEEEGEVVVPARVLSSLLQYAGDEKVTFSTKGTLSSLQAGKHSADIKTADAKEFPIIPEIKGSPSFSVPGSDFSAALSRLVFLASTGEIRPELAGVFCSFEKGRVRMAATDSFRLGEQILSIPGLSGEAQCILPTRTVAEVVRAFSSPEVLVQISSNQICIKNTEKELVSRLIEGKYPEYAAVIPTSFSLRVQIERNEFIQIIRSASIFSGKNKDIRITISPTKKTCIIEARNSDLGEQTAEVPCVGEGKELAITCNYQYLLDALGKIEEENISLEGNSPTDPILIKGATRAGIRYLIMPLRSY